jgi:hypothetical protein
MEMSQMRPNMPPNKMNYPPQQHPNFRQQADFMHANGPGGMPPSKMMRGMNGPMPSQHGGMGPDEPPYGMHQFGNMVDPAHFGKNTFGMGMPPGGPHHGGPPMSNNLDPFNLPDRNNMNPNYGPPPPGQQQQQQPAQPAPPPPNPPSSKSRKNKNNANNQHNNNPNNNNQVNPNMYDMELGSRGMPPSQQQQHHAQQQQQMHHMGGGKPVFMDQMFPDMTPMNGPRMQMGGQRLLPPPQMHGMDPQQPHPNMADHQRMFGNNVPPFNPNNGPMLMRMPPPQSNQFDMHNQQQQFLMQNGQPPPPPSSSIQHQQQNSGFPSLNPNDMSFLTEQNPNPNNNNNNTNPNSNNQILPQILQSQQELLMNNDPLQSDPLGFPDLADPILFNE